MQAISQAARLAKRVVRSSELHDEGLLELRLKAVLQLQLSRLTSQMETRRKLIKRRKRKKTRNVLSPKIKKAKKESPRVSIKNGESSTVKILKTKNHLVVVIAQIRRLNGQLAIVKLIMDLLKD